MSLKKDYLNIFKEVPKTGVIYVLEKAREMGYKLGEKDWANLGQGAPETGPLENEKIEKKITITEKTSEYGPVGGLTMLRQAVADYYNTLYRKDLLSKYSYKNVCIAGGGRVALARVVAALGNINMGHFIPDYTAYEELLGVFKNFVPIPVLLDKDNGYKISIEELSKEIIGRGLSALLISNPCNPTGQVIVDNELKQWISIARDLMSVIIFDEFYSHYVYNSKDVTISSAKHIHDVNKDPIIIINGLSKNWRSPGWRIGWVLGPEEIIERVASAGSFLDGGAVHPLQEEAFKLINPETAEDEAKRIQRVFRKKREYTIKRLKEYGIKIDVEPEATFYVWCNISKLPSPINQSFQFFKECLKEKVIIVPGEFFDVNPGKRRLQHQSRYRQYVRVSFGPKMESLKIGLNAIQRVIKKFSN